MYKLTSFFNEESYKCKAITIAKKAINFPLVEVGYASDCTQLKKWEQNTKIEAEGGYIEMEKY